MIGQVLSVFAFWIFSAVGAPMEMEEGGMMPMENLTQSCLGNLLPEQLKPHYNTCMENMGEEMEKVEELILCVLKAHGLVPESEEDPLPTFPMSENAEAESPEEPFVMAHQECLPTEDVAEGKVAMLVSCLMEKLKMKCNPMSEEEIVEIPAVEN